MFLDLAGLFEHRSEPGERNNWHIHSCDGRSGNLFEKGGRWRPGGVRPVYRGRSGVVDRLVARRDNLSCDQPGARLRSTHRARFLTSRQEGWVLGGVDALVPVLGPFAGAALAGLFLRLVHF